MHFYLHAHHFQQNQRFLHRSESTCKAHVSHWFFFNLPQLQLSASPVPFFRAELYCLGSAHPETKQYVLPKRPDKKLIRKNGHGSEFSQWQNDASVASCRDGSLTSRVIVVCSLFVDADVEENA